LLTLLYLKIFQKEEIENTEPGYAEIDGVETLYKTSLGLSAVKKMLKTFGGDLWIREHHDLNDEGQSMHHIVLSIPCRLPAVSHDTTDAKHDLWSKSRGSSDAANVRDIVNLARQMIDFGMDTDNDDWFEHTMQVFKAFNMKIKRVTDEFSNLNLCRVIFVSSGERSSELRSLGYKGQLVLVAIPVNRWDRKEPIEGDVGADYTLEIPYTLDAMDSFFRSISLQHTLSHQPNLLTTLDRAGMALRPHERIPIVSWTIQVLQELNRLDISSVFKDFFHPAPAAPSSVKYPATSAYTPITSSTGSGSSTVAGIEDIDYEYLINNKIVASTLTHETFRIADNYLDETVVPDMPFSMLSKTCNNQTTTVQHNCVMLIFYLFLHIYICIF
jgi:hypothetical protein